MNFYGDYHTHTTLSKKPFMLINHASGTIEDNIKTAKEQGLKEIAITDHGFAHKFFGCSRKKLQATKEEIIRLSQKYDMKVYFGVEANFLSLDGTIDIIDTDRNYLDIVLCGYHKTARPKTIKDKFTIFIANLLANLFGTSKKLRQKNTQMVLNALDKNKIDVLTHINSKMHCDVEQIAKKASERGTLIELNEKHMCFTQDEINRMLKYNVKFIVDSDAHSPKKIGKFKKVESAIEKYNIPKDRIVNLENFPVFASCHSEKNI